MKLKEITYKIFQSLTKDKDKSVDLFVTQTLQKTQSMFIYKNLPVTIPQNEFEEILQVNGHCIVSRENGDLYALAGSFGGELNAYYKATKYVVTNPYLNISKEYEIGKDCVLIKNDYYGKGLINLIGKYAVLLTDVNISLNTCAVLTRLQMLISASDDKTKESADVFIEKLLNGDFSVIAENAFLKGVNLQTLPSTQNTAIEKLIELNQYYKANLLNEIGLNSNFNMKRERLNETEILLNNDDLLPFVENMLQQRKLAVEKINEMFDLNISVDLKCVWKTEKETNDKATETEETETEEEKEIEETEEKEIEETETENKNENEETEKTETEETDKN